VLHASPQSIEITLVIAKEHSDELEVGKAITCRFRGARSWEPAEAQGRSKVELRLSLSVGQVPPDR
jgi:hypothetical protein